LKQESTNHVRKPTSKLPRQSQDRSQSARQTKKVKIHDEVASIAKNEGFVTSTDDLNKFQCELSADELERVGGGAHYCCGGSNTSQVEAGCSGY
jgi:predicted ribosomally synthesized peptide with nif11-like leader